MTHQNKPDIAAEFAAMKRDAQETAVRMIRFCIEGGIGMGQDEGVPRSNRPRAFRRQLERLVRNCERE